MYGKEVAMTRSLPAKPSLRQLRNQARDILNAHKRGDGVACLVLRNLYHFKDAQTQEILSAEVRLSQVQFALAMEYGFKTWAELMHAAEATREGPSSSLIDPTSLVVTLDRVGEALFYEREMPTHDKAAVAEFVAARQGEPGAYANMFGPVGNEVMPGMRLFTGEKVTSNAGARHILGEEACRVLHLLDVGSRRVTEALLRASKGFVERLDEIWGPLEHSNRPWRRPGLFCCGQCSAALWRHLAARGDAYAERQLAAGIAALLDKRAGDGTWAGFPFHYTVLVLLEADLPSACAEIRYASAACQGYLLKRTSKSNVYSQRRRHVAERALSQR